MSVFKRKYHTKILWPFISCLMCAFVNLCAQSCCYCKAPQHKVCTANIVMLQQKPIYYAFAAMYKNMFNKMNRILFVALCSSILWSRYCSNMLYLVPIDPRKGQRYTLLLDEGLVKRWGSNDSWLLIVCHD